VTEQTVIASPDTCRTWNVCRCGLHPDVGRAHPVEEQPAGYNGEADWPAAVTENEPNMK
jgi:hypothetical protein